MTAPEHYVYFVSVVGKSGCDPLYGQFEAVTSAPITTLEQIRGVCRGIEEANPGTSAITVVSFQLLRTQAPDAPC